MTHQNPQKYNTSISYVKGSSIILTATELAQGSDQQS